MGLQTLSNYLRATNRATRPMYPASKEKPVARSLFEKVSETFNALNSEGDFIDQAPPSSRSHIALHRTQRIPLLVCA
jgi:hypothetical protein